MVDIAPSPDEVAGAYELFAPGECDAPLPLNRIADVFRFSRFVGIAITTDGDIKKVVLPRPNLVRAYSRALASARPDATRMDLIGGVPLDYKSGKGDWHEPLARSMQVVDVDDLLATRTLRKDDRDYSVELDAAAVSRLLAGREVVVPAAALKGGGKKRRAADPATEGRTFLRLTPDTEAPQPVALNFEIQDLASFLARPEIPMTAGGPARVSLDPGLVGALRADGRAEIPVGDATVSVSVASQGEGTARYPIAPPLRRPLASQRSSGVDEVDPATRLKSSVSSIPPPPASYQLVFNLQWLQTWELLGYSRGTLLNTVSLAPQEETTVEIFTWDRHTTSVERLSSVDAEESFDRSDTVRDTTDVMRQAQSESEFGFQASGTIGIKYEDILNISETVGASDRSKFGDVSKTTTNFIHEAVTKSAGRVKQSRQTKVSESQESGREERVSRKVRNANMCHALNLDYFEVLANYSITTAFSPKESGLCVLIDNPIRLQFDRWAVRVYERALAGCLLDRNLAPGFEAARLLESRDQACAVMCPECRCGAPSSQPSESDLATLQGLLNAIATRVATYENSSVYIDQWFDFMEQLDDASFRNPVYLSAARWWVYGELLKLGAASLYSALVDVYNAWQSHTPFSQSLWQRLRFELDSAGGVAAISAQKLYNENQPTLIRSARYEFEIYSQINGDPAGVGDTDFFPAFLNSTGLFDAFDDSGLQYLLTQFVAADDAVIKSQGDTAAALAEQRAEDTSRSDSILSAFPLRDVTDAIERESALLAHLNMYGSYYRAMLWNSIPPMNQLEFLRTLIPLGIVEPHAVGFLGDKLAFAIKLDSFPAAQTLIDELITQNAEVQDLHRIETVTIPTAGITLETRLGLCDGCEDFIQKQRDLDVALRRAEVDQAEQRAEQERQEAERYKKRLEANPPDLDDPVAGRGTNPIQLLITQQHEDA